MAALPQHRGIHPAQRLPQVVTRNMASLAVVGVVRSHQATLLWLAAQQVNQATGRLPVPQAAQVAHRQRLARTAPLGPPTLTQVIPEVAAGLRQPLASMAGVAVTAQGQALLVVAAARARMARAIRGQAAQANRANGSSRGG